MFLNEFIAQGDFPFVLKYAKLNQCSRKVTEVLKTVTALSAFSQLSSKNLKSCCVNKKPFLWNNVYLNICGIYV